MVGNQILFSYEVYDRATKSYKHHKIYLPRKLVVDKEFLYFLGLFFGDGTGHPRVGVVNKEFELIRAAYDFIAKIMPNSKISLDLHTNRKFNEELFKDRLKTLQTIFGFLSVDTGFYSPKFEKIMHISGEKGRKNRFGLFLKKLSDTRPARLFSTEFRMSVGRILYKPFSTRIDYPELDAGIREQLMNYLKEDIKRFRENTAKDFDYWSV